MRKTETSNGSLPVRALRRASVGIYHGRSGVVAGSVIFGALGLLAPACGASYQSIYEGEVRFEHCHRLDEEPDIPLTQRRECWREWTKFYTYGQTRDRLEYALRRQRELTATIGNPNADILNADATKTEPLTAPAPTSPFAAPPSVQSDPPDAGAEPIDPADLVDMLTSPDQPPAQSCLLKCLQRWHPCADTCNPRDDAECRAGCDAAFKSCGSDCLKR